MWAVFSARYGHLRVCLRKLENFLYENKDSDFLKLIDFGFSKVRASRAQLRSGSIVVLRVSNSGILRVFFFLWEKLGKHKSNRIKQLGPNLEPPQLAGRPVPPVFPCFCSSWFSKSKGSQTSTAARPSEHYVMLCFHTEGRHRPILGQALRAVKDPPQRGKAFELLRPSAVPGFGHDTRSGGVGEEHQDGAELRDLVLCGPGGLGQVVHLPMRLVVLGSHRLHPATCQGPWLLDGWCCL